MTADPWDLLETAHTVLVAHAHPDDESLATGALLATLARAGTRVVLVTATRGEEGEVVPGSIPEGEDRPLDEIRAHEIDAACAHLGITERHMLGEPPALAPGAEPRRYRDSGMRWVREGLAGPAETARPESFTRRPLQEATDDLVALVEQVRPDVLLGYDDAGSYGHPDHVQAHHVTVAAAERSGVPMVQFASEPDDTAFVWRDLPGVADQVESALRCYRTQLTVLGRDGAGTGEAVLIRHVGGQDDRIAMRSGLRR